MTPSSAATGDGVGGAAAAIEMDGAVGRRVAAVRGDLLDFGLARADVGERLRGFERRANGFRDALDGAFVEVEIADRAGEVSLAEDALGGEIGDGGVVLMDGGDHHPLGRRLGGDGEDRFPAIEGFVADFAPVDRDEDDRRLIAAEEDEAVGFERIGDALGKPEAAHHAVADGGGDVGGEGGEAEGRGGWRRGDADSVISSTRDCKQKHCFPQRRLRHGVSQSISLHNGDRPVPQNVSNIANASLRMTGTACNAIHGNGASWFGFDQMMRATYVAPLAPRSREAASQTPSETVIHDSFALIAAAPKLPNSPPRSGMTMRSVRRMTCSVCGSTCAMNNGARWRMM